MIRRLASAIWWRRTFRRHSAPWEELESFPRWPPDQQKSVLARRLLGQIQYFGRREDALPEWREAASIKDPETLWRVWPQLPIVNKRLLQQQFNPKEMGRRFGLEGRVDSTGGSTGEPTPFFHDTPMLRASLASNYYTRIKMGWRPGMATIIVWGSERDIGKHVSLRNRVNNWLLRDYMVDGYHINRNTVERLLGLVRREAPVAVYGFTSMLEFVAREALSMGITLKPGSVRSAWNGGEMLFPDQVSVFRQAFGLPILNRYGGRELSVMACQYDDNGPLHVIRPWLFAEVVNDQGEPAAPGESGRLVWTSTICRGTPFLRYDIGDLGSYLSHHHDESGISAISELHGRVGSLLVLPDGRKISNLYWNHLFKGYPEVGQFQVILKADDTLEVLLKGSKFSAEQEQHLRATVANFLGPVRLELKWVDNIPLTSQGKLVQVVRQGSK